MRSLHRAVCLVALAGCSTAKPAAAPPVEQTALPDAYEPNHGRFEAPPPLTKDAAVHLRSIRVPLKGAKPRPTVLASRSVEYSSLDRMKTLQSARGDAGEFSVRLLDTRYVVEVVGGFNMNIDTGPFRIFPGSTSALPASLRNNVKLPECRRAGPTEWIGWSGARATGWTDGEIEYQRFEGPFDFATCRAQTRRSGEVRARALVPKLLYAFRVSGEQWSRSDEDQIVILGPPSRWIVSSSGGEFEQTHPAVGSFSRLTMPVRRGASISASLTVGAEELTYFLSLRGQTLRQSKALGNPYNESLTLDVELAWPERESEPTIVAFLQSDTPRGKELAQAAGLLPAAGSKR